MIPTFSRRVSRLLPPVTGRPARLTVGPRFRPGLERLEERSLPSGSGHHAVLSQDLGQPNTLTVTNLNDSGIGSLRYELAQAGDGATIGFAPGLHGPSP